MDTMEAFESGLYYVSGEARDSESPPGYPDSCYEYQKLPPDHFRLLRILAHNSYLECDLETYSPSKSPKYHAVSHAWTHEEANSIIICGQHHFAVSQDIQSMLISIYQILSKDLTDEGGLFIWIDSLCINQQDDVEKASQVPLMAQIYSQSFVTIVWLGASTEQSDLLIKTMWDYAEWAEATHALCEIAPYGRGLPEHPPPPVSSFWLELGRFLRRPWFGRLWVAQEYLLSRDVTMVCGQRYFSSTLFERFSSIYTLRRFMVEPSVENDSFLYSAHRAVRNFYSLNSMRKIERAGSKKYLDSFISFLYESCLRFVSLPVDRVWALLGLAPEMVRQQLNSFVDYSERGMSDYHLTYIKFSKVILSNDPSLTLLSIVHPWDRPMSLPSWCPDFESQPLIFNPLRFPKGFHAGFQEEDGVSETPVPSSSIKFPSGTDLFKVWGCPIDYIGKISFPCDLYNGEVGQNRIEREAECLAIARQAYGSDPPVPDAHWRTLVGDSMILRQCTDTDREFYNSFCERLNHKTPAPERSPVSVSSIEDLKIYTMYADTILDKYCYFSTRDRRVGTCIGAVQEGDAICIFHGATTPFVVRYPPSGAEHSAGDFDQPGRLIVGAYVHGLMYGEVFSLPRQEKFITLE